MAKKTMRGGALLAPLPPTMVSCGDMESSNIITIGWTGILNTIPPKTYISVRPTRHSYEIIKEKGEFVINLTPSQLAKAADYCGVYTGKKVDKFEKCKLTKIKGTQVDTPMIEECPVNIECRVTDIIPLGSHDMFMADILAVNVDEELFDKDDKMRLDKANLICYSHGEYFELGKKIGTFGFSTKKKKKHQKKRGT
jgi:flavin reductase (DIM6/NTAB) family NADH-FMN oxidoreductase RutF